MRNKRMFSLEVINTDCFLDMPTSAQSLYFHFGMRADDDGFVSSPKSIMNMVKSGADDLRILLSKNYLIPFESGVVVITHWNQNNYLRKDRYEETKHKKEWATLDSVDGEYTVKSSLSEVGQPCGIPDDNQVVYPEENRIEENNNICSPGTDERVSDFEKIYEIYPKKRGRTKAFDNYCLWLKGKDVNGKRIRLTNREMYIAVQNYVRQQQEAETELQFYKNFDTLMGKQLLDYVEGEPA